MEDITFNILRLSLALLSFAEKSHGLYFEHLVCENRQTKLNCSVGNSIDDINITFHGVQDACSTTDNIQKENVITLNSISYQFCIGNNSCVLEDEMFNVSHSALDTTLKWQLFVTFDCVHISAHDHYRKPTLALSPFNMNAVNCTEKKRKIEIQSIKVEHYLSFCNKQNYNDSLTKCIQKKVNESCNGKQLCEQPTWNEPKFVNISFSCKANSNVLPLQAKNYVEGVAVGVAVGLIIIVGGVVVFIWFVRRKKTDDKQYMAHHNENTDMSDNIGNQNIALSANCNSEILSNLELSNVNSKQNNYEMAKPMNESEKDNYVFHENQYDVSKGNNCSEPQQGIYSRAVDTVYDSASHSRQNNVSDQTYDHAFGPTTEDNYDIANN